LETDFIENYDNLKGKHPLGPMQPQTLLTFNMLSAGAGV
jgi:hypothetical protein